MQNTNPPSTSTFPKLPESAKDIANEKFVPANVKVPDPPPSDKKLTAIFIGVLVILVLALVCVVYCKETFINTFTSNLSPTPTLTQVPTVTPTEKSQIDNWETYNSNNKYHFQVNYPPHWFAIDSFGDEIHLVYLSNTKNHQDATEFTKLSCPFRSGDGQLYNPKDWEGNEGGYYVSYYESLQNTYPSIRYIWSSPSGSYNELCTAYYFKRHDISCNLCTNVEHTENYTKSYINSLNTYNQILSTFKFTDQDEGNAEEGNDDNDPSTKTPTTAPSQKSSGKCFIGGCSNEICSEEEMVSVCVYKDEYACYKTATCEVQKDGNCGWTMTEELKNCLGNY